MENFKPFSNSLWYLLDNGLHAFLKTLLIGIKTTTNFLSSVAQNLADILLPLFHVIVNSCQWCLGQVLTFLNWTIASLKHLINSLPVLLRTLLTGIKTTTNFLSSVAQNLADILLPLFHVIVNSCQWCLGQVLTFLNWTIASLKHLIMDEHTFTLSSWNIALVILSCVLLILLMRSNNTGFKITDSYIQIGVFTWKYRSIEIGPDEPIEEIINTLQRRQSVSPQNQIDSNDVPVKTLPEGNTERWKERARVFGAVVEWGLNTTNTILSIVRRGS